MSGKDLYNKIISERDYSGSRVDQYAQLLMTIFSNVGSSLYPILETAELHNKKLSIKETTNLDIIIDEYTIDDIVII